MANPTRQRKSGSPQTKQQQKQQQQQQRTLPLRHKDGRLKLDRKNWTPPPADLLKKVREALPKRLFQRDLLRSFSFVAYDLAMVAALFYASTHIDTLGKAVHPALPYLLWPAYWFAQGVVCTGLWVLAHECGHHSFSDYKWVDNTVGYILHSALLVPFYSWKITHGKHHKVTCHMNQDQVFVPWTRGELNLPPRQEGEETDDEDDHGILDSSPLVNLKNIVQMLLLGWPAYLIANASGQPEPVWTSHFRPDAPIFEPSQYSQILQSDIGVLIMLGVLTYLSWTFSFLAVLKFYVLPYLWVNLWLVMITFLQHTDERVPHYREKEFNFTRGALATVDRDYGILNHFFHHIGDTHVVHHMFSTMPHYNALEATEIAKEVLGEYYLSDDSNVFLSMWRSKKYCKFVEDEGEIVWYKH